MTKSVPIKLETTSYISVSWDVPEDCPPHSLCVPIHHSKSGECSCEYSTDLLGDGDGICIVTSDSHSVSICYAVITIVSLLILLTHIVRVIRVRSLLRSPDTVVVTLFSVTLGLLAITLHLIVRIFYPLAVTESDFDQAKLAYPIRCRVAFAHFYNSGCNSFHFAFNV